MHLAGGYLPAATAIWGAGIRAADGADWVGGTPDRGGRIPVDATLAVKGNDGIYVIGDVALCEEDGHPLSGLAQVAQQQGRHLGKELRSRSFPGPFRYRSHGDTAVIGRYAAVYSFGKYRIKGRLAWLLWAIVHIFLLIGWLERRTIVMFQWTWSAARA